MTVFHEGAILCRFLPRKLRQPDALGN